MMNKSKLEEIIHRKSVKIWDSEYKQLQDLLNNFFKNRPHFHQYAGWYRIIEPIEKFLLGDRERVIKNIEEAELNSFIQEVTRVQNYLSEDQQ
jgi:hypothetical protein